MNVYGFVQFQPRFTINFLTATKRVAFGSGGHHRSGSAAGQPIVKNDEPLVVRT